MATVRRIREEEWERLREVRLEALGDTPYAFHSKLEEARTLPDKEWQTRARNGAEGSLSLCVIATEGEKTVGMAAGFPDESTDEIAHLVSMWVRDSHRGTDVAIRLVDFVVEWAADRGAEGLLAGVTTGNDRALRFYDKIGFKLYDGDVDMGCETVLCKNLVRKQTWISRP